MYRTVANREKIKKHLRSSASVSKVYLRLQYEKGKTLRMLEKEFSLSLRTLARYIKEAGGILRARGAKPGGKRKAIKPDKTEKSFRTSSEYLK